jgi:hypothetical protein
VEGNAWPVCGLQFCGAPDHVDFKNNGEKKGVKYDFLSLPGK